MTGPKTSQINEIVEKDGKFYDSISGVELKPIGIACLTRGHKSVTLWGEKIGSKAKKKKGRKDG